jgi:hypothetical protein
MLTLKPKKPLVNLATNSAAMAVLHRVRHHGFKLNAHLLRLQLEFAATAPLPEWSELISLRIERCSRNKEIGRTTIVIVLCGSSDLRPAIPRRAFTMLCSQE